MDFGVVGLDGVVGSGTGFTSLASDPETKQKWYGSGSIKQERSGTTDDNWKSSKLAKTGDFSTSTAMLLQQRNTSTLRSGGSLFSDAQPQQQMLNFASHKPEVQNATLPHSYHTLSAYTRNAGYSSASLNGASMHGVVSGSRGPFTPSQWLELEHQALIYKYITANVPVPSNLLIPIRKALDSAGFCSYSGGLLRHNPLGWGSFHLGLSSNTDPEPGRCRRTDGKKWRCSRDAVPDQKYCERHMNRGRHRSRKPVEGQSGHAVTGITVTTSSKLMPNTSSSVSVMVGGAQNSLAYAHQHAKTPQPNASNHGSVTGNVNRMLLNDKVSANESKQGTTALTMFPPAMDLKSKENSFMLQEPQFPYQETPRTQFGLATSDSLINPSQESSVLMNSTKFGSPQNPSKQKHTETPQSLRYFIDDWPKNQSVRGNLSWQDVDRTPLSISIPMGTSDFLPCSATNDKLTLSPLRLARGLEPMQKGLGLGSSSSSSLDESGTSRQANWIPISWENSLGGPLGEVLHHSNNNGNDCMKNSFALNLVSDGWDSSSPLRSSPTGVLQKTTFRSVSNSSTGSSPRAENKTHDGTSLCNDLLGSTLRNSSSLPAL